MPFLKVFAKFPAREVVRCYVDSLDQKEVQRSAALRRRCIEKVCIHDCPKAGALGIVRQSAVKVQEDSRKKKRQKR